MFLHLRNKNSKKIICFVCFVCYNHGFGSHSLARNFQSLVDPDSSNEGWLREICMVSQMREPSYARLSRPRQVLFMMRSGVLVKEKSLKRADRLRYSTTVTVVTECN